MRTTPLGCLVALTVALFTFSATPARADQNWACSLALCLANPAGPLAVAQCVPHVKRAWRAWAKRKSVPTCIKVDAKDVPQGELTDQEGRITMVAADPLKNCPTDFRYYATRHRKEYCAFSGVTEQYIGGKLWGRIWYGGPDSRPWVEQLVVDPDHPRAADTLPADWKPIKADIQDKADRAHTTYQVWLVADQHAKNTAAWALTAWNEATSFSDWLQAHEATVNTQLGAARKALDDARDDLEAFHPDLVAAETKAKAPGASASDVAAYDAAKAKAHKLQQKKNAAGSLVDYWKSQRAQLPFHEGKAARLNNTAQTAQAVADQARADANAAKKTAEEAEAAAQPLAEPTFD